MISETINNLNPNLNPALTFDVCVLYSPSNIISLKLNMIILNLNKIIHIF
jgi:hypothetical protein